MNRAAAPVLVAREAARSFAMAALNGAITSLLLGAADRAINLMGRFAACFNDVRRPHLIEHEVVTSACSGIALAYEDLNDHDKLHHDPVMAVMAGKLEARREDCAPMAGQSTLNRVELSRPEPVHGEFVNPHKNGSARAVL
jgi:DDE family transposase